MILVHKYLYNMGINVVSRENPMYFIEEIEVVKEEIFISRSWHNYRTFQFPSSKSEIDITGKNCGVHSSNTSQFPKQYFKMIINTPYSRFAIKLSCTESACGVDMFAPLMDCLFCTLDTSLGEFCEIFILVKVLIQLRSSCQCVTHACGINIENLNEI